MATFSDEAWRKLHLSVVLGVTNVPDSVEA